MVYVYEKYITMNQIHYHRTLIVSFKREFANYEHKRKHKHRRKKSIQYQRSMTSFK